RTHESESGISLIYVLQEEGSSEGYTESRGKRRPVTDSFPFFLPILLTSGARIDPPGYLSRDGAERPRVPADRGDSRAGANQHRAGHVRGDVERALRLQVFEAGAGAVQDLSGGAGKGCARE